MRRAVRPREQIDAFWSKVDRSGGSDACWPWTGAKNPKSGYGTFHPSRSSDYPHTVSAHRFAAHLSGLIDLADSAQIVDHTCHNGTGCPGGNECAHRACCNPAHFEAVDDEENLRRGWGYRLANGTSTKCINGHEYTPENTYQPPKGGAKTCRECARDRDRKRAA